MEIPEYRNQNIKKLEEAILKAIAFFDIFNRPLTAVELSQFVSTRSSLADIEAVFRSGARIRQVINTREGHYFIRGREETVDWRKREYNITSKKLEIARRACKILRYINGVKMVAVCNNISYKRDSDIDVFIVTASERIWFTRFVVTLILHLFGLRRHGTKISDRICLSFYISEERMNLENITLGIDPYFYYWLIFLEPIYEEDNCYREFWLANHWLLNYLPNAREKELNKRFRVKDNKFSQLVKRLNRIWFGGITGDWLERSLRKQQLFKMSKNQNSVAQKDDSRVVISKSMLKFHEEDRRIYYKNEWSRRVRALLRGKIPEARIELEELRPKEFSDHKGSSAGRGRISLKRKIEKIVSYGMYLLVFLLPWQTRWIIKSGELNGGYSEYSTISLYASDILIIGLFIFFLVWLRLNYRNGASSIKINKFWYIIAAFELIIFISIFFSENIGLAWFAYGRFLVGLGLFFLVVKAPFSKIHLIYSLVAGAFIQAVIGISQFITQTSFSSKWLGMARHSAEQLGASVIEVSGSGRWLRAYGALDHPNMLGGFLALGLVLNVFLISKTRDRLNRIILTVSGVIIFSGLLFSFSRTAWLAAAMGLGVLQLLFVFKKQYPQQKSFLQFVLIISLTGFIIANIYPSVFLTRFSTGARLEAKSIEERADLQAVGLRTIKENWLIGTGPGNYTINFQKNILSNLASFQYQPVHNSYLLVWAEIGIIGFLIYLFLLLVCFINSAIRRNEQGLAFLTVIIIILFFDHWLWSLHFGMYIFWVIIGLLMREKRILNNS